MKKSSIRLSMMALAVMFVLVLIMGCSSAPAPASAPSAERQYATVTFINRTGETIFYLYISERTDEYWGDDWLGSNVLEDNGRYTTRLLTGEYDVLATDLSQDTAWTFWITVDSDGGTFAIEPADKA
jgi:hypothetical protein